mgnify:FL=1
MEQKRQPRLFSTRNYVIDLETLALGNDAVVTAAALSQFGGSGFGPPILIKTWTIDPISQQRDGRKLDADTCLWWMLQPEAARQAIAGEDARRNRVHPLGFVVDLLDILAPKLHGNLTRGEDGSWKTRNLDFTLWAKPQHFDVAILEHLAHQYKVPDRDLILHRRKMHNVRTALALVNAMRPASAEDLDEVKPSGDEHSAAADAMRTADVMTKCMLEMDDIMQRLRTA